MDELEVDCDQRFVRGRADAIDVTRFTRLAVCS